MGDTAAKKEKASFWSKVKTEFKKIIWPSQAAVGKKTAVVIVLSVIIGAIIALLDTIFQYGINFLMGL